MKIIIGKYKKKNYLKELKYHFINICRRLIPAMFQLKNKWNFKFVYDERRSDF